MNAAARMQLAFQMLANIANISIPPEPVFQNMRQDMSARYSSND